jgi:hypothetical protein
MSDVVIEPGATAVTVAGKEQQRQALIHRLCLLQRPIAEKGIGYSSSLDCFCRVDDGGYVAPMEFFSNTGKAVDFIEQAVAEKLDRISDARDTAEAHIRGLLAELADQAGVTVEDLQRLRGGA